MRELNSHKLNGINEYLSVVVVDVPGPGNACHAYDILSSPDEDALCLVRFQKGPIREHGVNGVSNEALLAIVEDRLLGFQSGEYACWENSLALMKIQEAMRWLQKRTRDRVARGVEGTDAK